MTPDSHNLLVHAEDVRAIYEEAITREVERRVHVTPFGTILVSESVRPDEVLIVDERTTTRIRGLTP